MLQVCASVYVVAVAYLSLFAFCLAFNVVHVGLMIGFSAVSLVVVIIVRCVLPVQAQDCFLVCSMRLCFACLELSVSKEFPDGHMFAVLVCWCLGHAPCRGNCNSNSRHCLGMQGPMAMLLCNITVHACCGDRAGGEAHTAGARISTIYVRCCVAASSAGTDVCKAVSVQCRWYVCGALLASFEFCTTRCMANLQAQQMMCISLARS